MVLLATGTTYAIASWPHIPFLSVARQTPVLVHLGSFTTNLDNPFAIHYIQVKVSAVIQNQQEAQTIEKDHDLVQNNILAALHNQTYSTTLASSGMTRLEQQIKAVLDGIIHKNGVRKVYFTSFLVQ